MDIELFRSWCLELPEAENDFSVKKEFFKINKKTFAIIECDNISLKCDSIEYQKSMNHPDITPAKGLSRYNWITINKFDDLQVEDIHEFIINSYELIVKTFPKKIRNRLLKKLRHDIDSPWKVILNIFFREFIEFFFPNIADDIDWTKAPIFMDKELNKIIKKSIVGKRSVDKLVKVWRKNGHEIWVMLHIEIQSQAQEVFPERMFVYSNRLKDIYQLPIASLAILADNNPNWRPSKYSEELWGCQKTFVFPTIKLLDYQNIWNELEKSDNPFAVVVMTHLKMLETKNNKLQRLDWKIGLTKNLYGKGYTQEQIFALFTFIDWLLILPRDLTIAYNKAISQFNEENKMRYLTTPEQIGRKEGRKEGRQEERFFIAKKMKKQGFETPIIKNLTGLKDKDLKKL